MKILSLLITLFFATVSYSEIKMDGIPGVTVGKPLGAELIGRLEKAKPKNAGQMPGRYLLHTLPEYKKLGGSDVAMAFVSVNGGNVDQLVIQFTTAPAHREQIYKWIEETFNMDARPFSGGSMTYARMMPGNQRRTIGVDQEQNPPHRISVSIGEQKIIFQDR